MENNFFYLRFLNSSLGCMLSIKLTNLCAPGIGNCEHFVNVENNKKIMQEQLCDCLSGFQELLRFVWMLLCIL